jgi:PAS domain S-box-containing protein
VGSCRVWHGRERTTRGKSGADESASGARSAPDAAARQYRLLFERAPLPYVVTDFGGTIRAANRAAAVMLKRPSELLEGKSLAAFVPLECRAEFRETLAALPHAGAPVDVAMHASVLDGAWEGGDAIFWLVWPRRRRAPD